MGTSRRRARRPGTPPAVVACVLGVLLGVGGGAHAGIYKLVDAWGNVTYTDEPEQAAHLQLVETWKAAPARPDPPASLGARRAGYDALIARAARAQGLSVALVHAVVTAESAYDAGAVSSAGAVGLMQLMPATARRYGVRDRTDPEQSLRGGTRYLRELLDLFAGDLTLALAAYNAGENAVIAHGRAVPPYAETREYVRRVQDYYARYRGEERPSADRREVSAASAGVPVAPGRRAEIRWEPGR